MKTPLSFPLLATLAALAATLPPVAATLAQSAHDTGWNARFAALDEEHAAQAGVAVSIVFDDSGSMSEHNKMPMAKMAFHAWIADAPADYRFGLVALNAGKLVDLKRDDKPQVLAAVDRLRPGGDTPLADTIAQVGKEIRQRRAAGALYERQVAVILTDGEDNTRRGVNGVQDEINRLRADRVEVIAFGYQGEGDYMRDCATHFFSPANAQDIRRGLNAIGSEIGDTSDVVVDPATLARMRSAAYVAPPAAATPVPSLASTPARVSAAVTDSTPSPGSVAAPRRPTASSSHSSHWFLRTVLLVIAVRFVFGLLKRK